MILSKKIENLVIKCIIDDLSPRRTFKTILSFCEDNKIRSLRLRDSIFHSLNKSKNILSKKRIKKIDINRISKNELKIWIRNHSYRNGITIMFYKTHNEVYNGRAIWNKRTILLDRNQSKKDLIFCFFHELAHFEANKKGWFMKSELAWDKKSFNELLNKDKKDFIKSEIKMEEWCDKFGYKQSLRFFKYYESDLFKDRRNGFIERYIKRKFL